jgi:hypothetical protein
MILFERTGLPSPYARWIAAAAAVLALGCVPAADTNDDGNDSGVDDTMSTMTMTSADSSSTDPTASDGSTGTLPMNVSFSSQIQPILDENCVVGVAGQACHQTGGSWFPTIYTADMSYATLLEGDPSQSVLPYVTPMDIENSYVWRKLTNTITGVGRGLPMPSVDTSVTPPMEAPPLPQAEMDLIHAWINEGAMNN